MERKVEVTPLLPTVQPVPAATDTFQRILKLLEEIYPAPEDYEANIGETVTVPPFSRVTVTWTLKKGFKYYISKVYVDAAPNCTYQWRFPNLIYYDYKTSRVFEGNTHEFPRRLVAMPGSDIILQITNTGTATQTLDIIVEMWARRV